MRCEIYKECYKDSYKTHSLEIYRERFSGQCSAEAKQLSAQPRIELTLLFTLWNWRSTGQRPRVHTARHARTYEWSKRRRKDVARDAW